MTTMKCSQLSPLTLALGTLAGDGSLDVEAAGVGGVGGEYGHIAVGDDNLGL